ncbi:MAG TPA: substrate-binding domain-containing protein [Sphingomonas sp.]
MAEAVPARMMSALILRALVDELVLPALVAAGSPIDMVWDPTVRLMERLRGGETADGIVAIDWAIDELAAAGRIAPGSRRPLARAAFGIAVARGAAKPDISDAARLRETLLAVPSLVYSRTGASGLYFERLIDRLGIGEAIRAKAIVIPAGLTGETVARGEALLAVQQVSELLAVPGIDILGPFPADVQETTDFSAAIFADAADPAGARAFVDQLFTARLREAYLANGLKPLFD